MLLKLAGLVKRGELWTYRRVVPPQLRSIVGRVRYPIVEHRRDEGPVDRTSALSRPALPA